jgi:hypothetical protein
MRVVSAVILGLLLWAPLHAGAPTCRITVDVDGGIEERDARLHDRLALILPAPIGGDVPRTRLMGGEIRGRVRTPEGLPIEGAIVEFTGYAGGASTGGMLTAADGSYRLRVSPGTWDYYPTVFLEPHVRVDAGRVSQVRDLELVHTRAVRMKVTVRDETGAVVPSASVHYAARRDATSLYGTVATGHDGTAAAGPVPPGVVRLHARARTGATGALAGVLRVSAGYEPLDDVTMVLSAGATVRGRVEFDGRPGVLHGPSGLRVVDSLAGHGSGWQSGDPRGAVNQDGSFELDALVDGQCLTLVGLPAGWYVAALDLFGDDYRKRPLRLAPGEVVSGLVIRVAAGNSITVDRGACTPGRLEPP